MARLFPAILAGVGGYALLKAAQQQTGNNEAQIIYVSQGSSSGAGSSGGSIFANFASGVFDALSGEQIFGGGDSLPDIFSGSGSSAGGIDLSGITSGLFGGVAGPEGELLSLIGSVEAPQGYDQVWGGISRSDYPAKPITQMTVAQVLSWQDSIDHKYRSEAAGRYQVMEDTLRGLVRSGDVSSSALFDRSTQDRIAVILMERRGLRDYQSGRISLATFGNNLAKEWASLPVLTGSKRGASYYAGDGLNRAHVSPAQIEATLGRMA